MKRLIFGLGLLLIPSFLFADMKVSNMNEQLTPKTTDQMYIVANSTSMKVTVGTLLNAGTWYVTISSQEASNVVNQGQYLMISSQAASNLVNQGQYLMISSQAASNLVNQGQYLMISSQAASNLVNQGQYLMISSQAASNIVNQGQYLMISSQAASNLVNQSQYLTYSSASVSYLGISSTTGGSGDMTYSSASVTYTHLSTFTTHASRHQDGGADEIAVTAGMMNAGTGASGSTFWRGDNTWATPAGGGGASSLAVTTGSETGMSVIIASPTAIVNFSSHTFGVRLTGGATAFVTLTPSSVTLLGADPSVGGDVSGTLSNIAVTDDSHAHTGTSLSGIDISADTNLAVSAPVVLTDDTLSLDSTVATYSTVYTSMSVTYTHLSTAAATYQPLDSDLTDLADGSLTGSKVGDGVPAANIAAGSLDVDVIVSSIARVGFYSENEVRTNLGLAIGSNVQAYDADLDDLADGSLTGSKVGDGVPSANIAAGSLDVDVICSSCSTAYLGVSSAPAQINLGNTVIGTLPIANLTTNASSYWNYPSTGVFVGQHGLISTTTVTGGTVTAQTTLVIPSGTTPDVSSVGEIAMDTTDGGLVSHDGTRSFIVGSATKTFNVTISSGATWDSDSVRIFQAPQDKAITILSLWAEIPSGTSLTFNVEERAIGSLGSAGTDILAADVAADTTGEIRQVFSNSSIAAGAHLVFTTGASAASGAVPYIGIQINYVEAIE